MKAYRDLSKELGREKLQELKFPEVHHYQQGGKEASLAGKMKTRPVRHSHNKSSHGVSNSVNVHTEYTCESNTLQMGSCLGPKALFLLT